MLKLQIDWALLGELPGRARSVHIVDYCVHASMLGSEGQICWFWISFNISEGVAFEKKLIWALLGKLQGRARSVHIVDYCVHASTLDSEGQTCWFLISFNFSEGVAFEKKIDLGPPWQTTGLCT